MKRNSHSFRIRLASALIVCAIAMLFISSHLLASRVTLAQDPNATLPPTNKTAPAKKTTPPPKKSTPRKRTTSGNASADEIAFWASIKDSTDPEDFKAYLQQYPSGKFVALAKNKLKALEAAKSSPSPTSTSPNPNNSSTTNPNPTNSSSSKTAMPPNPPPSLRSFDFVTPTLDGSGNLKSRDRKSANAFTEDLGGGVKLEMVAIPPGEFVMGSPETEANRSKDEGPHRVRINYWFYMGEFEVTQAQWRAVMGTNPSNFKDCDECPVEEVSWDDAVEFCRKLSARTGRVYRLPSEAEWEYAARAGTTSPFAFGETITPEVVNYDGNYPYASAAKGTYRQKTVPGGSLGVANAFGLYDMHGNVWEWCQDWYHDSYAAIAGDAPTDGSAWLSGGEQKQRVLRGGSWFNLANATRSAIRGNHPPDYRYDNIGFRVVAVR
jgi:formylglycine-generating enzyme required for sulfatase activity